MGKLDQIAMEEKIRKGKEKEMKEKRKQTKEKIKKEKVSFFTDFKNFITKGNVLDLAVAVVISTAFNAIVTGLVKYIITPFITNLTSGQSVEEWKYVLKAAVEEIAADGTVNVIEPEIAIQYGLWIQTIIDFIIIAFSIFVVVRLIKNIERKMKAKEIAEQEAAAAKQKKADAKAAAEAAAAAQAEKEALAEFYANVKEQTALLKDISSRLDK
ncbi:MAG: large conductance mechanosensitive channel protein MscL [Ruminococcaceae bacterium]|nr:large conductance mechanosensitive channel protein MscL [Oscillospiraceae bacterium]